MSNFVEDQNEETLEIVEAGPLWNKDPFLRIKRDVGIFIVHLVRIDTNFKEEGKGEDDEEEEDVPVILVVKPHTYKRKTTKEDQKGKGIDVSPEKPKKKSMSMTDEVARRKRKFLPDSTIFTKKAKEHFWT